MNWTAGTLVLTAMVSLFATNPTSTNFNLKSYDFGTGGDSQSSSSFKLDSLSGEQTGDSATSTNFVINSGELPTQGANVSGAPTFVNSSNYYNRLHLTLDTAGNPSDTSYAIAISADDFVTTLYVKADQSIGSTLILTDYKTFTSWGGGSGFLILGLTPNTTYKVKIKAFHGNFTETKYGPTSSASTVQPQISFSVITTLSGVPPFNIGFSGLGLGTVFSADSDAIVTVSTNALSGAEVYVSDLNSGLYSSKSSYTINSTTTDLGLSAIGYGAIVTSTGQTTGGPIVSLSPYNGAGNNVGGLTSTIQKILTSSAPVSGGTGTVRLKAKTNINVPAETDYSDVLNFIATAIF